MRRILFTVLIFTAINASSQKMTDGFVMLEKGDYTEATLFFKDILQNHPENKTARLCYGRAIGLKGQSTQAVIHFTQLKKDYPQDFEVALNYGESLLWDKNFAAAKTIYKELVKKDSTSFSAVLGYANCLSNLKEYNLALQMVDNALQLQPTNNNALTSKKYMLLGKAAQLTTDGQFTMAMEALNQAKTLYPEDPLIIKIQADTYLRQPNFKLADSIYNTHPNKITALTGRSVTAHLQKKDKQALVFAEEGLAFAKKDSTESKELLEAQERYTQALIWNANYKQAKTYIAQLQKEYPSVTRIDGLEASLGMYLGDFKKSIAAYNRMLEKDTRSFDGNLGIANAYKALGNTEKAKFYGKQTLTYYPNQKDALALLNSIENEQKFQIENTSSITEDNGNNTAFQSTLSASIPMNDRLKWNASYSFRETENVPLATNASNNTLSVGAQYRIHNNTWLTGDLNYLKAQIENDDYTVLNGSVFLKAQPFPKHSLEAGYRRNLQDFNATLIEERILMNDYVLNYNLGTNINLGWYTGLTHTQQTDGNSRNLIFTSLYYIFTKQPILKGGINYQYLSFKDQVPSLYFSPSSYQAVEAFLDLSGNSGKWNYSANIAGGYQLVEQDSATTLYRLEGKLNYTISKKVRAGIFGKYSNIASATATGFEFMEIGVRVLGRI